MISARHPDRRWGSGAPNCDATSRRRSGHRAITAVLVAHEVLQSGSAELLKTVTPTSTAEVSKKDAASTGRGNYRLIRASGSTATRPSSFKRNRAGAPAAEFREPIHASGAACPSHHAPRRAPRRPRGTPGPRRRPRPVRRPPRRPGRGLLGSWRGSEVPTGHPFDGLLELYGWWGKRFDGPDEAHPLVFEDARGRFSVDPPASRSRSSTGSRVCCTVAGWPRPRGRSGGCGGRPGRRRGSAWSSTAGS